MCIVIAVAEVASSGIEHTFFPNKFITQSIVVVYPIKSTLISKSFLGKRVPRLVLFLPIGLIQLFSDESPHAEAVSALFSLALDIFMFVIFLNIWQKVPQFYQKSG